MFSFFLSLLVLPRYNGILPLYGIVSLAVSRSYLGLYCLTTQNDINVVTTSVCYFS